MELPKNQTLVLSKDDIQNILRRVGLNKVMDELIQELTIAIKNYHKSHTSIPTRSGFHYDLPQTGLIEWMPIYKHESDVVIKVVGYHPNNPKVNQLPTIVSTISSYDTASGHLKSIMDGVLLTALRTGASSAIASRFLADKNSSTLGLIGCGAQSVTQLHALSRLFQIKDVLIYDVDEDSMQSFEHRVESMNLAMNIQYSTIEKIVELSDILCTATSIDVGEGPLFDNIETKPHLHINAIGADFPGKTEIPLSFLKQSFVCPDFLSQALIEGECQKLDQEDIGPNWVEVIQNPSKYESVKSQRSTFDSTGWALEDQVVAELFTKYAQDLGLGQQIEIENVPKDAKSPYEFMTKNVIQHQY